MLAKQIDHRARLISAVNDVLTTLACGIFLDVTSDLTRRGVPEKGERVEEEGEVFCCRDEAAAADRPSEERKEERRKRRKAEENTVAVVSEEGWWWGMRRG